MATEEATCARCDMGNPVGCVWRQEPDCLLGLRQRHEGTERLYECQACGYVGKATLDACCSHPHLLPISSTSNPEGSKGEGNG